MGNKSQNPRKGNTINRIRLWRNRIAAAVLVLFSLTFCTPGMLSFAAQEPEVVPGPVSMQVEYGYDGTAKGGRYLPVKVNIENHRDLAVVGSLQIQVQESDDTIYRYDFEANIDAHGTMWAKEHIPLGSRASQLYVALVDAQGERLAGQRIRLNISMDVPELFIGVLSDQPEALKYLDGVGVSYSTLRTRVFEMHAEDFPRDAVGLNLLDVLVVNNYKLRSLSGILVKKAIIPYQTICA